MVAAGKVVAKICLITLIACAAPKAWAQMGNAAHIDLYAKVQVAGFATPVELRQSGTKTRVDILSGGVLQTYIADRDKGVLIALTSTGQNRLALVFPLDRADGIIPMPLELPIVTKQAAVKAVGASLVSGRSCRLMEFSGYLNQSGIICVTQDNIILQMTKQGRKDPLFQVMDLAIGPQDAKWFRPPADYRIVAVPGIGGASATGEGAIIGESVPPSEPKPKAAPIKP